MAIAAELAGLDRRTPADVYNVVPGGRLRAALNSWGFRTKRKLVHQKARTAEQAPRLKRPGSAGLDLVDDLADINNDPTLKPTTRKQLIEARVGQGDFRKDLLKAWGGRCAVTGCAVQKVLRASHILPWCESDNAQRRDPDNGLLLTANLDALFDAGLIGFDEHGAMLVSSKLTEPDLTGVGQPLRKRKRPMSKKQARYLAAHRKMHGLKRP